MAKVIAVDDVYDAIVDDADYERLSEYTWTLSRQGFAISGSLTMQEVVCYSVPNITHINDDTLDNRRSNLYVRG